MSTSAVITIGLDPDIHLGPLTVAWHGLTIAIGLGLAGLIAGRLLRRHELDPEPLTWLGCLAALGGIVGARIFYVAEHGGPLLGTRGFTFDGGFILAAVLLAAYVRLRHLDVRYLDAAALAMPFGVAVGRIGDIINGEHYGKASTSLLAVRNSNPEALTPDPSVAFQNGGLYEVLLGSLIALVVWPLRDRLPRAGDMVWLVIALFAAGRFFEFFLRSDSPPLALGLSNAQWTSVVMLLAAVIGRFASGRHAPRSDVLPAGG